MGPAEPARGNTSLAVGRLGKCGGAQAAWEFVCAAANAAALARLMGREEPGRMNLAAEAAASAALTAAFAAVATVIALPGLLMAAPPRITDVAPVPSPPLAVLGLMTIVCPLARFFVAP